ncbi:MAG: hypothetical protein ACOCWO_01135, partial [Candidatus Muiribacteriaceae bacterium]
MRQFLNYRNISYISIAFFFIVNVIIFFNSTGISENFFPVLSEHNDMYSAYQRALGYFEQNMDDVNWKKNFNS